MNAVPFRFRSGMTATCGLGLQGCLAAVLLFLAAGCAQAGKEESGGTLAGQFIFDVNRFGRVVLDVNGDKGSIEYWQGNKKGEEMVWKTPLTWAGDGNRWKGTLDGSPVEFELTHLDTPVVNDTNRHINSGDYRLQFINTGKGYRYIKSETFVAIFDTSPGDYIYGKRTD